MSPSAVIRDLPSAGGRDVQISAVSRYSKSACSTQALLDQLFGAGEQRARDGETKCIRRFAIAH